MADSKYVTEAQWREELEKVYGWRVELGRALGLALPDGYIPGIDQLINTATQLRRINEELLADARHDPETPPEDAEQVSAKS